MKRGVGLSVSGLIVCLERSGQIKIEYSSDGQSFTTVAGSQRTIRDRHRPGRRAGRTVPAAGAGWLYDRDALRNISPNGSEMLGQDSSRPRVRPGLDIDRPQIPIIDVLQRHRHDPRVTVDIDAAEELQSKTGREIFALLRAAALLKLRGGSQRISGVARQPMYRVNRPQDEFPEQLRH